MSQPLWHKLKIWAEMIKLEHTLFSLPFLFVSMILAYYQLNPVPALGMIIGKMSWAILALLGARSAAMTINRILDARFDALNPRTVQRAIPQKQLSPASAWVLSALGFALMCISAWQLNTLCLLLSPLAIAILSVYSLTKRFTWLCHYVLGISLGGAVLGGWVAFTGSLLHPLPWTLSLAVCFWVAGFDILYALQDLDFDRQHRLHSIPARWGHQRASLISLLSHAASIICFWSGLYVVSGLPNPMQIAYAIGCSVVSIMLILEHYWLRTGQRSLEFIFFFANAFISTAFLACLLIGSQFS